MSDFDLKECAGKWPAILSALLHEPASKFNHKGQACPECGGKDRFRFTEKEHIICNQCIPSGENAFTYLKRRLGRNPLQEIRELVRGNDLPVTQSITVEKPTFIRPCPELEGLEVLCYNKDKLIKLTEKFEWIDERGQRLGYIGKINKIPQQIFFTAKGWYQGSYGKNQPLLGLQNTTNDKPVLIVEGEKCYKRAMEAMPDFAVVTWSNGAHNIKNINLDPLLGKKVYIWPDQDDEGYAAAEFIGKKIAGKSRVHVLKRQEDKPQGWDIADLIEDDWTVDPSAFLKENLTEAVHIEERKHGLTITQEKLKSLIRPLGYRNKQIHFLPYRQKSIFTFNLPLKRDDLPLLAPSDTWKNAFPNLDEDGNVIGFNWERARELLYEWTLNRPYNPDMTRSLGVWKEGPEKKIVVHLGDRLLVDGEEVDLDKYEGEYIYEAAPPMVELTHEEFTQDDYDVIEEIVNKFSLEHENHAMLLIGMPAHALLGQSLNWRAHMWIAGAARAGKSTTLSHYMKPLLGGCKHTGQSSTTEAGIRQLIGDSCLPAILDESESNDKKGAARNDGLMEYTRSCSDDSAPIIKGSPNGDQKSYKTASSFILTSVGTRLLRDTDIQRYVTITFKEISKDPKIRSRLLTEFTHNKLKMETVFNREFSKRYTSFILRNVSTFLHNIEVTKQAYLKHVRTESREGDMIGGIIGAYATLKYRRKITEEDIVDDLTRSTWNVGWDESITSTHEDALQIFKDYIMQYETWGDKGHYQQKKTDTIDTMICKFVKSNKHLIGVEEKSMMYFKGIDEALKNYGIKVDLLTQSVEIRSNNTNLAKVFANYPQLATWNSFLSRLPGVQKGRQINIGSSNGRGIAIPFTTYFGGPLNEAFWDDNASLQGEDKRELERDFWEKSDNGE